ncbi:leucyl aminopeptidase [Crenobacter sp. SG2305]|uniref:leucyl aminopeptidase n=1 Tax=Crenobacter oryzisoli TaxID=3056844 RepID=UPI0025AA9D50|nr:leucyl aminopeptidase [Crenobacter sp. SG2305]MDN0082828.1 leucyl aminopeptidase [Crenobacter sp. SG2305]
MLNKPTTEFTVTSGRPDKQRTDCVIVGVYESGKLSIAACALNRDGDGALSEAVKRGCFDAKLGSTLLLPYVPKLPCSRVLLVGLGKEKDFHGAEYTKACQAAGTALAGLKATEVVAYLPELYVRERSLDWKVEQAVVAFAEALYRFEPFKRRSEPAPGVVKIALGVPGRRELKDGETGLVRGRATADGLVLTRDLANLPGNVCTPSYLADVAQQLAEGTASRVEVLDETQIAELKMGSFLAVAQGSVEPPRLIVLEHRGADNPDEAPVVLVGKGITFDAGGISLKPAADMDAMKYDMAGAAALLGVFRAVQALMLPLNLVVVIPTCENLPSGQALRPGDIVTTMSGQTIEVLNTDAEGRLLLCDALTYALRFKPAVLIDVATLTGACVVALGHVASGLFCNKQSLARELIAAGDDSGDRVWPMPLFDDYQKQLDSPFADLANIGGKAAGSITAACFLSRFVGETDWAHLDIAGTASRKEGATGRPVRMLLQYLQHRVERRNGGTPSPAPAQDSAALLWENADR